jgi:PAS domain S-box-containing protein
MDLKETISFWENQYKSTCDKKHKLSILKTLAEQCKEIGLFEKALHYLKLHAAIQETIEQDTHFQIYLPEKKLTAPDLPDEFQVEKFSFLDTLFQSLSQNIVIIDIHGKILYANQEFLNFNNLNAAQIRNYDLSKFIEDFQFHFSKIITHLTKHQSWQGKLLHKRKKDDFRWADITVLPFHYFADKTGIYLFMESFEDEKFIPDQFPFMVSSFENPFETGILLLTKSSHIIYANSYAQSLIRHDNGKQFEFLFHPNTEHIQKLHGKTEGSYFLSHNMDNGLTAFVRKESNIFHPVLHTIILFEDATHFADENIPLSIIKKMSKMQKLGITISDINGKIVYVNPVEVKMHYYSSEELLGKDIGIFAKTRKPLKIENIKNLKPILRESSNYRKDGTKFSIRLLPDVILDDFSQPIAVITCSEDMSGKKKMQEELIRFSAYMKSDLDAIFNESIDGTIINWNKQAETLFGYTEEEIKGKSSSILADDETGSKHQKMIDLIHQKGFVDSYETRNLKKGGIPIYVSLTISPIRNTFNQTIGYSTIAKDVSEKYVYLQKIEHLNAVLQALREIDLLIHREKNPTALIKRICSLLVRKQGYPKVWFYLFSESKKEVIIADFQSDLPRENIIPILPEIVVQSLQANEPILKNKSKYEAETRQFLENVNANQLMLMKLSHSDAVFGVLCVAIQREIFDEKQEKEIFINIAHDISFAINNIELEAQRKKMELALWDSEIKFRKLFENSNDAIFLHDWSGVIFDANGKAAEMIGLPLEQLQEFNLFQLFPDDSQQRIHTFLLKSQIDDFLELESYFERVDGLVIDVLLTLKLIDGNIIQSTMRDITSQKWAEEALESNLTLLQTLLETIPNPMFYKDPNGVFLGCNQTYCQFLGYEKEEIIGRTAKYLVSPEQAESWSELENKTMKEGRQTSESQVTYPDNTVHQVITTLNSFHWQNQQIGGIVGVILDITERKEMEEALKESEQKYKLLTEDLKDIVLKISPSGELEYISPAIYEFAGYQTKEVINTPIMNYFADKKELLKAIALFQKAVRYVEDFSLEFLFKTKYHEKFYVEISGHPILSNKQVVSIHCVMRDIRERKVAEEQKAMLYRELELVNQELNDFAYVVSHDLKAPLRGIHSLATWLAQDYAASFDEDGKEQLNMLIGRANRMHDLIEGILQYSRVGRVSEEKVAVDLQKMIPEIIDLLAPPPHFLISIETNFPVLMFEKTRIKQVFQNLISNAIKYNDKAEGKISIGCQKKESAWLFYVRDNGPGIESKHFETIFKMFQTINPKDDFESTGIGLTIIKRIIEMYNGKIWLESNIGEGTTFYFIIPSEEPC